MAGFLDYLKDASSWLKSEENQGTVGLLSKLGTAAFSGSDFSLVLRFVAGRF